MSGHNNMPRHPLLAFVTLAAVVPACPTDTAAIYLDGSTTFDPLPSTAAADPSTTVEVVSTSASADTGTMLTCGDRICEETEESMTCPEDCNICGDAIVFGDEDCDNGVNDDLAYAMLPAPGACTPDCKTVAFCGDGVRNGPEPCDDGAVQTAACEADCRLPVCGDQVVNVLAGEACDDANRVIGDGCSPECIRERLVFLSSQDYSGDFDPEYENPTNLHGIPLADARCNALADIAGLRGEYKAWLSDFTADPADRFDVTFEGLYRLPAAHAPIIAHSWQDLTDGVLLHPINIDENGEVHYTRVWTNTLANGHQATFNHCKNWTKHEWAFPISTTFGTAGATDTQWTSEDEIPCWLTSHIYCFEDLR